MVTEHPSRDVADAISRAANELELGYGTRLLQIGASGGQHGDPVHYLVKWRKGWKFFLTEPRMNRFRELVARHKDDLRVVPYRAAVVKDKAHEGDVILWEIAEAKGLPDWTRDMASLNKKLVEMFEARRREHHPNQPKAKIVPVECRGLAFDTLLSKLGMTPDVLVTDMEGSDAFAVLPALAHRLKIVCYEHRCFDETNSERLLITAMARSGYSQYFRGPEDVVWIRR